MIGRNVEFRYGDKNYKGLILDKILFKPAYLSMSMDHYTIECKEFDKLLFVPCNTILRIC